MRKIFTLLLILLSVRTAQAQALSPSTETCQLQLGSFVSGSSPFEEIQNLVPSMQICRWKATHKNLLVLRRFEANKKNWSWVVDGQTLQTAVAQSSCFSACLPFAENKTGLPGIYVSSLESTTGVPFPISNNGLTHAIVSRPQLYLTADLCPSHKPLDRSLFENLTHDKNVAVPMAINVSGNWIRKHEEDFQWLRAKEQSGALRITWANHSDTHPYVPHIPDTRNFLLSPGVNFDSEIFGVEKLLFSHGVVPSVFFRFPGLVSDQKLVQRLAELGLIPLGADAWLALGQPIHNGSVILIHANGNEPLGIHLLFENFRKHPDWPNLLTDLIRAFY